MKKNQRKKERGVKTKERSRPKGPQREKKKPGGWLGVASQAGFKTKKNGIVS